MGTVVEVKAKKENVFTKMQKSVKDFNGKHPKIAAGLKYTAVLIGGLAAGFVYSECKHSMKSVDADDPMKEINFDDDPFKEFNMDSDDVNDDLSEPEMDTETETKDESEI